MLDSIKIASILDCFDLRRSVELNKHCTMKTGGVADYVVFPKNSCELEEILRICRKNGIDYSIIGNASNTLFLDCGYDDRVVIITSEMKDYSITDEKIMADCGVSLTSLAIKASKLGLCGLEFAYGIPGTVGGAVYMNAGAYGGEMSSIVFETKCYDIDSDSVVIISHDEHNFGYRKSVFSEKNLVILSTCLELKRGNAEFAVATCEENMRKRKDKQPLNYPNCGSAFKRPQGYFAGELIEKSGLKGYAIGGAQISEKHAGFVINKGDATTSEILTLMEYVQRKVYENFGVLLEAEIKVLQ